MSLSKETHAIKLFENFSSSALIHFKRCLFAWDDTYLITGKFRELVNKINSGMKSITISGPKGVGKTWALGAIATLCHEVKRPCFLWSPLIKMDPHLLFSFF